MQEPTPPPVQLVPGQTPTPEQIAQIQAHFRKEAAEFGITYEAYVELVKAQAAKQQQAMMDAQQQQQQEPIQPGPPKPEALAVANWLRKQELKPRTCIFQEKRKEMFRVKRAIRALESPAYEKARTKNPLLPPVTNRAEAENCFKLLPMSLLALRVEKVDPEEGHEGHNHANAKRIKGLWTVGIVQQQDAGDDMHYMWLYEGSQWKQKAYAIGALACVMTLVMFPLWPLFMRQGVWYLSMGMLGLVGLFFVMAFFRLILFGITMFTHAPGLWLYPNLFEDVGFFDSFRPVWGWQETEEDRKAKRKAKKEKKAAIAAKRKANGHAHSHDHCHDHSHAHSHEHQPIVAKLTNASGAQVTQGTAQQRRLQASVEEEESD
ncbi:hypothetical protein FKW77_006660 [Venturia effusa]|uniref:Translocation protein SEC62 n=1 Tax=Venturia effusa TaxID=50376 RepID=A0A517L5L0_9PEZI|nr:hypothetical protein FKW77_006660 [Venturia effusa]